ncbi:MAG: COX15/CtaA family protein [Cyclobacteriaceae bacterium]|nr:COX15/CtaA family protein [Cyclobacteriaceae bacterium]
MKNNITEYTFFRKISLLTLIAVYFLILVGGIVRSTGAGMGCPDWPKCFGQWIPPASEEMLPDNYKEQYVNDRIAKNQKFAGYLEMFGFEKQAEIIRTDNSIRQETTFNVMRTWTEYVNRIVGVVIGLLIIVNLAASVKFLKSDPAVFIWSAILFILVVFQGWIGSIVVSTHLTPWMVTLHMLIAVLIIAILVYLVFRSRKAELHIRQINHHRFLNMLLVISGLMIVFQILLGTQVREAIDMISSALNYNHREAWIGSLGTGFYIHRSFSLVLLAVQVGILINLYMNRVVAGKIYDFARFLLMLVVLEVGLGVIMAYFGIPPFIQPLHLLIGILIFGVQFLMILMVNNKKIVRAEKKVLA